jgi:hypothetical protein
MLEADPKEYAGYGSFAYFCAKRDGELQPEETPGLTARAYNDGALALPWSGLVGRLRGRGNVLWKFGTGDGLNSSFSEMLDRG